MAGCDTGYVDIDATWTEDIGLRKYSSHKSWYSRYIHKVQNLSDLLDRSYDSKVEEHLITQLQKAENTAACLQQISHFLTQIEYEKWKDHDDEVREINQEVQAVWDDHVKKAHARAAAAKRLPAAAAPRQEGAGGDNTSSSVKIASDLKPDTLAHDALAVELRIFTKKFESYYHGSHMYNARLGVQQAYLRNCLDNELALQLDAIIQPTTPVVGAGETCLSILAAIFRRRYPPLLRRKQFFHMTQQAGQDERAFLESLKAAANEADIEGMTLQDALCMVLVSGIKDTRLREKMSEIKEPTLDSFSGLIDAHLHGKATAGGNTAVINKVSAPNRGGRQKSSGGQNRNAPSEAEKKRRAIMKGKCFRCGSGEHMANACNMAKDVRCRKCNSAGHIAAACSPGNTASIRAVEGESSSQAAQPLALEYQPEKPKQQAAAAQANYVLAYPTLQASYPQQRRNGSAYINAVQSSSSPSSPPSSYLQQPTADSAASVSVAAAHQEFEQSQREAAVAYASAQTKAVHNKPTPPLLL